MLGGELCTRRVAFAGATFVALFGFVLASQAGAAENSRRTADAADYPTLATAGAAKCIADPVIQIGGIEARRSAVVAASGPEQTLIAYGIDHERFSAVLIASDGTIASRHEVALPAAHALCGLWRIEVGFVVASNYLCAHPRYPGNHCLHLLVLSPEGKAAGRPLEVETGGGVECEDSMVVEPSLLMYWGRLYDDKVVARFEIGRDGAIARPELLATSGRSEVTTGFVGLAGEGKRWLLLLRSGEDDRLLFTSSTGEKGVVRGVALGASSRTGGLYAADGSLWLLQQTAERPRQVVNLDYQGRLAQKTLSLAPTAAIPAQLGSRVFASLERRGDRLIFFRRKASGASVGNELELARARPGRPQNHPEALLWTGSRFFAAWIEGSGKMMVRARGVECR
jgi:hypothetical protein